MFFIIAVALLNGAPHTPPRVASHHTLFEHHTARGDCDYSADRTADVSASGLSALRLAAGAGSLRIVGKTDISTVRVRGHACASSRALLEDLQLRSSRSGSTYRIETLGPDDTDYDSYARIDLVIEIPASFTAHVSDGSGTAIISGIAAVDVDDGSGSLEISEISGDVKVDDGSGDLVISNVGGDVAIDDGSGEVDVRDVRGSVTIDDGSGSIRVARVGRSLTVASDGSGDIRQTAVTGPVRLPDDDRRRRGR